MQMLAIPLQTETRPDEGLALTWFEVPGAIRYGLIIGVPGAPMPDLDVIMRGQTQQFAIVGVPARFTGAVDIGTPTGETRQFGMVAYRNDGEILAVPSLQIHPARSAPRDREYHAVVPPALVDPNPPSSPPQEADPNDPWSALEAVKPAGHGPVTTFAAPTPPVAAPSFTQPSPSTSPTTAHSPAPYDPWDVLSQPAAAPEAAAPASVPAPIPTARYEAVAAQLPVEPAPVLATPAPETPGEPALHLESPAVEHAAEAAAPISSTPVAEDSWAKEPESIAPVVAPETPRTSGPEFTGVEAVTPQADHAAVAPEVSDRQAESLAEPEPASTATAPEMSESPAIEVTPLATWERGFAVPPEIPHEEPAPPVAAPPISAAPPVLSAPPPMPARPAPPLSAELAAVLDEAELYLLPQWADPEAARRLLEQAEREAPEHPRVRALRAHLDTAAGGDNSVQIAGLLEQADRSMNDRDYWTAVDYYEQILAEQPEHEGALAGLAKARLRARWPTRLAGASGDATALQALGDDAAAEMPDLAGQAYAAAFAIQPGVDLLRGWLIAFVHAGHGEVLARTARRAVQVLEERGKILPTPAAALALDRLEQAAANGPAATEPAVHHLCDILASAAP